MTIGRCGHLPDTLTIIIGGADEGRLSQKSAQSVSTGLCVDEVDVVTWRLLCKDDVGQSIPYTASSHARQGERKNWQNM